MGQKWIELQRQINLVLNEQSATIVQGKRLTNYEEAVQEYKTWKETVDDTVLPDVYRDVNYTDISAFFDSLKTQSSLEESWFVEAQERFEKWLESLDR